MSGLPLEGVERGMDVRRERPAGIPAIDRVNARAFGRDDEADLVDALRANGAVSLSLVATIDDAVVGHTLRVGRPRRRLSRAGAGPGSDERRLKVGHVQTGVLAVA